MKENRLKPTAFLCHSSGCRSGVWSSSLRQLSTVLATLLLPLPALAHPGHGHGSGYQVTDWRSVWHYVLEPEHGLILVFAAFGVGAFYKLRKRTNGAQVKPRTVVALKAKKPAEMQ